MARTALLFALAAALACSRGKSADSSEPKGSTDDAAQEVPSLGDNPEAKKQPGEKNEKPPSLDDLTLPDGLPALDLKRPKRAAMAAARKHNSAGLKLHRAGKLDEAAELYRRALAEDAGHLLARYNLAGVLVKKGTPKSAIAILKQLKDNGCRICLGIVIHARTDKEWADLTGDPHFKLVTDDVAVENPKPKKMAKELMSVHINDFDETPKKKRRLSKEFSALFHPRRPVRLYTFDNDREKDILLLSFDGPRSLEKWLHDPGRNNLEGLEGCEYLDKKKSHCCTFEIGQSEDKPYLSRVCLKEGPGGALYLDRLSETHSI